MPPQYCQGPREPVTSFMHPAPRLNEDETSLGEDKIVADPLADVTLSLWNDTAKRNREIFSEIFRTVPTDRVRNWEEYSVRTEYQSQGDAELRAITAICSERPTRTRRARCHPGTGEGQTGASEGSPSGQPTRECPPRSTCVCIDECRRVS